MLSDDVRFHLTYSIGKDPDAATPSDLCRALSLAVRQRLTDVRLATERRYTERDAKRVYYLSMEFLMGRSLENNLLNLGLRDEADRLLTARGSSLEAVLPQERDAALGNGGLGRLAACFLDSLATLGMPGFGYGIHYEFGLFKQEIVNGEQRERPDHWFAHDSPWIVEHLDEACLVPVYGHVEHQVDRAGSYNPMWLGWKVLIGVPHDLPVVGWEGKTVNVLRLYSARASDEFDMKIFNDGDYFKAVEQKAASETVSKVLYPSDSLAAGRELRLVQEYFLVACAVRDIVHRYRKSHASFDDFSSKVAIQLNDTHPALTVAELMRVLVDEESLDWDRAWEITRATLGYTNHTLLPEALEKWSVPLLEKVLPRHLQIIYEINRRFLDEVSRRFPGDDARLREMSIVEEGETKQIRMAYLSIVGQEGGGAEAGPEDGSQRAGRNSRRVTRGIRHAVGVDRGKGRDQRANHLIAGVGDVDRAVGTDGDTMRETQQGGSSDSTIAAVIRSALAGNGVDDAVRGNLADPAVVRVGDVHVPGCVYDDSRRFIQFGADGRATIAGEARVLVAGKKAKDRGEDELVHGLMAGIGDVKRAEDIER
jgi:starch phosphorylase